MFIDICYTVGIFNIYYMEEILEWREKFKNNTHPDIISSVKYCTDIDYDVEKMNMFYSQVKYSDEFRGESFAKTFPEFYKLLKQYADAPEDF